MNRNFILNFLSSPPPIKTLGGKLQRGSSVFSAPADPSFGGKRLWIPDHARTFVRVLSGMTSALTFAFLFSCLSVTLAETPQDVSLSPDAEKFLDKGLAAAEQQEWDLAIRYFNDALEDAPLYPLIYFNLALAHEKAGHELVAMSWFRAYLQADPKARNRRDIEKAITNLEVATEAKAKKIFTQAEEAANQLPDEYGDIGGSKSNALLSIYGTYASGGDIDTAVALAEKYKLKLSGYDPKMYALWHRAYTVANEKKQEEAMKIAQGLPDSLRQGPLEIVMLNYQNDKKLDQAYQIYKMFPKPQESFYVSGLAQEFARDGDWNKAIVLIEKLGTDQMKFDAWLGLARAAYDKKKSDKVNEFLDSAEKVMPIGPDSGNTANNVNNLARACVDVGDKKRAEKTIESHPLKGDEYGYYAADRATIYARIGDLKKAEELFPRLSRNEDRGYASQTLTEVSVQSKDWAKAKSYLRNVIYNPFAPTNVGFAYATVAWGLIKDGKESEARQLMKEVPRSTVSAGGITIDHENAMYKGLATLSAKDKNYKYAYEFLGEMRDDGWKDFAVSAIVQAKIEDKSYHEALKLLEDNLGMKYYAAEIPLFSLWLRIVDELEKDGKHEDAIRVLDKTANAALKRRDLDALKDVADGYAKFKDKEHEKQVREWVHDLKWIVIAKEFEKSKTYDPETAYREIQKKEGKQIPSELANFAREYLTGLEKIHSLEH